MTQASPAFVARWKETGTDYPVYVDVPREKGPAPLQAVILTDGDYTFDAAAQQSRDLQRARKIPPTAIIGIGYGKGFGESGNFRGRDYTPTEAVEEPGSGGAAAFLSFLTGSLWPELSGRHDLDQTHRTLAGHSLGSLLVLHALFQPDPFFDRALAGAPSIWWDGRSILKQVSSLRAKTPTLRARLYLGVGLEDSPSMKGDLEMLEQDLASQPFEGLSVVSERFPGLDHYNSAPQILGAGLASLLG